MLMHYFLFSAAKAPFANPAAHVHPGCRPRVIAEEALGKHHARHLYENPYKANYSKIV